MIQDSGTTEKGKIKEFTDLIAWREAHKLVIQIYRITKRFPKEEIFGLRNCLKSYRNPKPRQIRGKNGADEEAIPRYGDRG